MLFFNRKEFAAAWMNLGIVKAGLKKSAEAERCYYTALTHRRKYPDCLYNLGNLVSFETSLVCKIKIVVRWYFLAHLNRRLTR